MGLNCSDLDGEVQNFHVAYGDGALFGQPFDDDKFYPADGRILRKNSIKKGIKNVQVARNARRDKVADSRAYSKRTKADAKLEMAKAQTVAAKGLAASATMPQSIIPDMTIAPMPPTSTGLSKNAKIGIGIGVGVVILSITGYFLLRKKK